LDEALRPLTAADVEEWEGWVELESEPVSSMSLTIWANAMNEDCLC
jgi:hypothetical protein